MSLKRGNLQQLTKDGEGFEGSGRDEPVEAPQRATAAQMAGRKIKQPRSRFGGGAGGGSGGISAGFGNSVSQPAAGAPLFQPPSSSGGFNFSAPKPVNGSEVQFGSFNTNGQAANAASGGYNGSLFSVPPTFGKAASKDTFSGNPMAQTPTGPSMFSAPSNFNFSSGPNNNPFSAGSQQPTPSFGTADTPNLFPSSAPPKSTSSNLFGAAPSVPQAPKLFGSSTQNIFGQQTSSSQAPGLFVPQVPTQDSQNETNISNTFDDSQSNSMMTDDSPTRPAKSNGPGLFQNSQQAARADSFAPVKTAPPSNLFGASTQSTTSNIFAAAASGDSKPSSKDTSASNLFGTSEQKPSSNLFSFTPTTSANTPAASTKTKSIFSDLKETPSNSLFGKSEGGASSQVTESSIVPANNTNTATSAGALFGDKQSFNFAEKTAVPESGAIPSLAQSSAAAAAPVSAFGAAPSEKKDGLGSGRSGAVDLFGSLTRQTPSLGNQGEVDSGRGNASVQAATPLLGTLNSSAPLTVTKQTFKSILDLPTPPAPSHLSEDGKAQWPDVWRSRVLEELFKQHMKAPGPDGIREGNSDYLWIMWQFNNVAASLKQKILTQAQARPSGGLGATRDLNALFPTAPATYKPSAIGSSLFGKGPPPVTESVATPAAFTSSSAGPSVFQPVSKPENSLFKTTSAAQSSSLFVSEPPSPKKRKPEETLEKSTEAGSFDQSKKSRMDTVSYPVLPDVAESAGNAIKSPGPLEPPKFKVPNFGAGTAGGSFLSQFGAKADKTQSDDAKKRKDEDYDSEEEDLETWKKKDEEAQKAKKAEYEAIAKNSGLGFVFKPAGSAAAPSSPFAVKETPPASAAVQTQTGSSASSIFAKPASDAPSASAPLFGSNTTSTAPGATTQSKPLFSFESKAPTASSTASLFASASSPSTSLFGSTKPPTDSLFTSSSSILPAAKQMPPNFTFSASASAAPTSSSSIFGSSFTPVTSATSKPLGSSLFGSTPPLGQSTEPKGGLFDRVSQSEAGSGPKEATPQDNTFKGDASTPIKFSKSLPPSLAPPSIASETSRATTPATGDDAEGSAGADDEAPREEQLDLSQTAVGEEDEDVLLELRAKGSELVKSKDGKADWVVRGVGQLKLLQNKESKKTRLLLRSSPAAKIVLNTQLVPSATYSASGAKNNTVRLPVVTGDGKIQQYILMVKEAKDASKLAALMEENKQR